MPAASQFIQLPLAVLKDSRISAGAKLFLAHLLRWDWGNGCWFTEKQLARELGISVRSVRNHTKTLEEAGYLWVFEDREGMTVRLVVRPGHVYPKPRGLGKPLPQERKKFSMPAAPNMVFNDFEVHETTTDYQLDPVLEEPVDQEQVDAVVTVELQKITEETPNEPPETVPKQEEEISAPNPLDRAIEVLQDAGVVAPVAQVLARQHSAGRIRAAVAYADGYRGELLNRPGYVVSALQDGWKLPKWCFRPVPAKNEAQEGPSKPRPLPDPASNIPLDWEDRRRESPYADLWDEVCGIIEGKVHPESFATWIQPCYISGVSEGTVTLAAPNRFIAEWLEEHYLWLLQWTLREMDESVREVMVTSPTSDIP